MADRRFTTGQYGARYNYTPPKKTYTPPKKTYTPPTNVGSSKTYKPTLTAAQKKAKVAAKNAAKKAASTPVVPKPAPAPKQIVAEVGDDFDVLASKLGIETKDLVTANPNDTTVKAGAAYNVPVWSGSGAGGVVKPTAEYGDFRMAEAAMSAQDEINARNAILPRKPDGVSTEDWIKTLSPEDVKLLSNPPSGFETYFDAFVEKNTNLEPGSLGTPEYWTDSNLGNWFWEMMGKINEKGSLSSGSGAGGFVPPPQADNPTAPVDFSKFNFTLPQTGFYTDGNVDWSRNQNPPSAEFRPGEFYTTGNVEYPDVAPRMPLQFQPGEFYTSQNWFNRETAGYEPGKFLEEQSGDTTISTGEYSLDDAKSLIEQQKQDNLSKLKIPQNPSAFEAVNWLTGAGLTGTALLSAGRQLRLDRPEYWDATGARADVLEGMEKFLIAEFGNPDGTINWDDAVSQDPFVIDTLDKLGYLDQFAGQTESGGYYTPSYSVGSGGGSVSYGGPRGYVSGQRNDYPTQIGLVSWSI